MSYYGMTYEFWALGRPKTKGSTKFVPSASTGKPVPKSNPKLAAWAGVVSHAAGQAGVRAAEGGVILRLRFYFLRPKSHYGTGKNAGLLKGDAPAFPTARNCGDVDKLARAVLDALTGIAYADDSSVVRLEADKRYSLDGREGVRVNVTTGADW